MTTVDQIDAIVAKAKQELTATNQHITAARANLRAIESVHADTASQVESLQGQAAKAQAVISQARAEASAITQSANNEAARIRDAANADATRQRREVAAKVEATKADAEKRVNDLTDQVKAMQHKLGDMKDAYEAAKAGLAALKKQAADFAAR
jgi:chromosome segregation ATPase